MVQGRVLLVDDEPSILKSYGRTLIDGGFDVTKAEGSVQALRRLKTMTFDVILTLRRFSEVTHLRLSEVTHSHENREA
jgi:DNA-binding NtrC family response regulator